MSIKTSFAEREPITTKSPASIREQIHKLSERGLIIDDVKKAYRTLETINYYRIVHYFAVFLEENGQYKEGTRFEDGLKIYEFDRRLRTEVLVAVEEIEIAARAAISNFHASRYEALGYRNESSFDRRHNHRAFMNKIERIISKNANLTFVRHHNKKYGGEFPLWVVMEMFSFGTLAVFYQDMKLGDKKEIAEYYFNQDHRNVESWLDCLAILRNRCAHYNRIYGNPLPGNPRRLDITLESGFEYEMGSSLFDFILIIGFLHRDGVDWGEKFSKKLGQLFDDYENIIKPEVLGFPQNWREFFI
jgi:abortive infection bacteriophage resistance protein